MLVKRKQANNHLSDLRENFEAMRVCHVKSNPEKCTFGVTSGKFLGYLVINREIKVDPEKVRADIEMPSATTLKGVQNLNRILDSMVRFTVRSSEKCKDFFDTLRKISRSMWTTECEHAFQKIKEYLAFIPILQKPEPGEVLTLYLAATNNAVSTVK